MNRWPLDKCFDAIRHFICDRIHFVLPSHRICRDANARRMKRGRKNVGRSCATYGYDGITRLKSAEKKLECADFVASTHRGIEIVALDPETRKNVVERLYR